MPTRDALKLWIWESIQKHSAQPRVLPGCWVNTLITDQSARLSGQIACVWDWRKHMVEATSRRASVSFLAAELRSAVSPSMAPAPSATSQYAATQTTPAPVLTYESRSAATSFLFSTLSCGSLWASRATLVGCCFTTAETSTTRSISEGLSG